MKKVEQGKEAKIKKKKQIIILWFLRANEIVKEPVKQLLI